MSFHVLALPSDLANAVRSTGRSPQYGHPAEVSIAKGYGPCRSCLRTFEIGAEERVLFTYNPFEGTGVPPQPGPVFVHAAACNTFEGPGFPASLRELPLLFEAYDERGLPRVRVRAEAATIEADLGRLLDDPSHAFVLVRNAEAGCFIARVTREE
jgi:hypothetical protein